MAQFTLATPRAYLDGFKDESIGETPVELQAIPQNCPLYFIMAPKGRAGIQFGAGAHLTKMYGSKAFEETSKFYSHQTHLMTTTTGAGQLVATKRLFADDARAPVICIGVEVVENENVVWELLPNGQYKLDINGKRVDSGTTQMGYLARVVRMTGVDMYNWNKQVVSDGTWTGSTGKTSKIYPVMAFIGEVGEDGNNVGFRLSQESSLSAQPSSLFAQRDQEAILYRFSWMKRAKVGATPVIQKSLLSADSIDFSFKPGMTNIKTNQVYDYRKLQTQWEDTTAGNIPRFGPVQNVHFYNAFIDQLQELLYAAESAVAGTKVKAKEEMNIFGELDYEGRAYSTLQAGPVVDNSLVMDGITTNYLQGGLDGTVSEEKLDELVKAYLEGDWNDSEEPLNSWADYPFSGLQDSGFSLETKYAFLDCMSKRDDITVDVCTFIAAEPENDLATELAIGQALVARGLLNPESIIHGTQACRFSVWGSEGQAASSIYGRRCSSFVDVAKKFAEFGGAGSGFLNAQRDYTDRTRNSVSEVVKLTHTFKPDELQDQFWATGINYPQKRSMSDVFWAAYQTGYEEDTSVLNGRQYVNILTYLKRLARYHWSINTGSTGLTEDQFKLRSDDDWAELIEGRFAGKMVISGTTVITPDDSLRGFSWALDINAAADPMRTVGQYNITVNRLS
ncbi:tail sheath protein [Vibrio phage C-ZP2022]|nr:tail sheath protein [Vibrio phage C-ZP2022]